MVLSISVLLLCAGAEFVTVHLGASVKVAFKKLKRGTVVKLKDWQIRALKTFAQAFGGILVPELVLVLNGGFPENWSAAWAVLAPIICSALAAGISAAWNVILERLKVGEE